MEITGALDGRRRTTAGASPPWAHLPGDALGEIAGRLRDAADFVRFHALGLSDNTTLRLHSPFSRKTRHPPPNWTLAALRGKMLESPDIPSGRVLALGCSHDGDRTATIIDPLTGDAASLPPLLQHISPCSAYTSTSGIACTNGVVVLHARFGARLAAVLLRPGQTDWEDMDMTRATEMGLYPYDWEPAMLCSSGALAGGTRAMAKLPPCPNGDTFVLESQGVAIYVKVVQTPPSSMVFVYALEVGGGGTPRWVLVNSRRDLRHMCMFLDKMSYSGFAVDGARKFTGAEVTGGYAYIVEREWIGRDSMHVVRRYGLENGRVTVVAELPAPFDRRSIWYTPRPRISQLRSRRA
ncbi:hypothetical protein ACP70R_016072 [Stipagrostis hirtigluma subsp. patula]